MFCQKCGKGEQIPNDYCQNCWEYLPELNESISLAFGGETPKQNIRTMLFLNAMGAVICLMLAIALYATYLGTNEGKPIIYLTAAFLLSLMGWQASNIYILLKLRGSLQKKTATENMRVLAAIKSNRVLLPSSDASWFVQQSFESVTEKATDLVETLPRKFKEQLNDKLS